MDDLDELLRRVNRVQVDDLWPRIDESQPSRLIPPARRRIATVTLALAVAVGGVAAAAYTISRRAPEPIVPGASAGSLGQLWTELGARPLSLPSVAPGAECPATGPASTRELQFLPDQQREKLGGEGPVYVGGYLDFSVDAGSVRYEDSSVRGWHPIEVLWYTAPRTGPILVRGGQVDGHLAVRFGRELPGRPYKGTPVAADAHLIPTPDNAEYQPDAKGWHLIGDTMFFRAPGCYAMQMDGQGLHEVVVFKVAGSASPSVGTTPLPSPTGPNSSLGQQTVIVDGVPFTVSGTDSRDGPCIGVSAPGGSIGGGCGRSQGPFRVGEGGIRVNGRLYDVVYGETPSGATKVEVVISPTQTLSANASSSVWLAVIAAADEGGAADHVAVRAEDDAGNLIAEVKVPSLAAVRNAAKKAAHKQ